MAKRENYSDLDELIHNGGPEFFAVIPAGDLANSAGDESGKWARVGTEYKNDRSAAVSAFNFRHKLGADRVRVAARGRFVYVYFKPVEEVAEAA